MLHLGAHCDPEALQRPLGHPADCDHRGPLGLEMPEHRAKDLDARLDLIGPRRAVGVELTGLVRMKREGVPEHRALCDAEFVEGLPHDPRLATWFDAFREQLPKDVSIHLVEGVLDASGALTLDTLLGIKLPADYAPVRLLEVTCRASSQRPVQAYPHWFDIVPASIDTDECLPEGGSYSSDLERSTSPAAARERMAEKAAAALKEGSMLVSEKDLPDAPSPPPGVERWYLVPKALATDA